MFGACPLPYFLISDTSSSVYGLVWHPLLPLALPRHELRSPAIPIDLPLRSIETVRR